MDLKLFAVLLGGRPPGATIEQHNMFFGVANTLEELFPAIKRFWSAAPKVHVDAYMVLDQLGDYDIVPVEKGTAVATGVEERLFFMNLGGYREREFAERHKIVFAVAKDVSAASVIAKGDSFFSEGMQEKYATPHIDDKHLLEEFDEHSPIEVGALMEPQSYTLSLHKARSGSMAYPTPVITGYYKIP